MTTRVQLPLIRSSLVVSFAFALLASACGGRTPLLDDESGGLADASTPGRASHEGGTVDGSGGEHVIDGGDASANAEGGAPTDAGARPGPAVPCAPLEPTSIAGYPLPDDGLFQAPVLGVEKRLDFVWDITSGDVNGDGFDDVVVLGSTWGSVDLEHHLFVFLQNACGTLNRPDVYGASGDPRFQGAVRIADLTGDGRNDVVTTIGQTQLFEQTPQGTLLDARDIDVPDASGFAESVATGDFDGDGRVDLATLGNGDALVLLQRGAGTFDTLGPFPSIGFPTINAGDVTGDGRPDLVVYDTQPPSRIRVLARAADGASFLPPVDHALRSNDFCDDGYAAIGDVTGDARADVVVSCGGNSPDAWIGVLAQTSAGSLMPPVWLPSLDIPRKVIVKDMDGDNRLDVVADHEGWEASSIYFQQSNGTLGPEKLARTQARNSLLTVADVNNDGKPDLVRAGDRIVSVQLNAR